MSACTHGARRGLCGFKGCIHYGKSKPPNPLRFDPELNTIADFTPRRYGSNGKLLPHGKPGHAWPRRIGA